MKNVINGTINSKFVGVKLALYQKTKVGAANNLNAVTPKNTPTNAFLYAICTACLLRKKATSVIFKNKTQLAHANFGYAAKSGTHTLSSAVPMAKQIIWRAKVL